MSPFPARLATALLAAAPLALAACRSDSSTAAGADALVDRVVLVTIDGLRADALDSMPALAALRASAAWTDDARSVLPAVTLPAHLSLLSGRDVTSLGIRTNEFGMTEAFAMMGSSTTPVFQWIDGASDAVIGASLLPTADLEQARVFFGVRQLVATSLDDETIIDAAIARATAADAPALLFVHLPEVDLVGHDSGWVEPAAAGTPDVMTAAYVRAVRAADAALARLHAVLAPAIAAGRTALVVTADHGGGHGMGCAAGVPPEHEHCTAHAADQSVPLLIVARDVEARRLPGVVPIVRVGPTVARLLGAPLPAHVAEPLVP